MKNVGAKGPPLKTASSPQGRLSRLRASRAFPPKLGTLLYLGRNQADASLEPSPCNLIRFIRTGSVSASASQLLQKLIEGSLRPTDLEGLLAGWIDKVQKGEVAVTGNKVSDVKKGVLPYVWVTITIVSAFVSASRPDHADATVFAAC